MMDEKLLSIHKIPVYFVNLKLGTIPIFGPVFQYSSIPESESRFTYGLRWP